MARRLSPADAESQKRQPASTAARPFRTPLASPAVSMPIEEIEARYPDEWVVVKVTGLDERQQVTRGRLLAHCRSQGKAWKVVIEASREDPGALIHIFLGGTPPATTEEWRERLFEAAGKIKDYRDAWW